MQRRLLFLKQLLRCGVVADALRRRPRIDLLLHQRRQHPAGANGVAGHARRRVFQRRHLGQPNDAVLGGDISGFFGRADQAVRRRDVDDPAPALAAVGRLHGRQRQPRRMERAAQVDGDHGVPFLDRKAFDSGDMLDAGVVDQNIDLAEFGRGEFHHRFDLGRPAHVGAVVGDLHAERGDFGFRTFHVAKTVQDDIGALRGQGAGDAQADTAGRAGDESCFTF